MNITSYSPHHIDTVVCNKSGKVWRCTTIYGHPETSQKQHTWTLLKGLASLSSHPWCCCGDFNEILHFHEKTRGNDKSVDSIAGFRDVVQACNLTDMGYKGYPFTWLNRRYKPHHIEERPNRFLCSKTWYNHFQSSIATNLVS